MMQGWERLIAAVQELSLARSLEDIQAIVRRAARDMCAADGATFVLREGDSCYYADEDAIAPLWKGCRFPMSRCISGWAMLNRQAAVIEDIYSDPRIPHDAYRPTFVKSLAMVPIRTVDPIGAIGNYWAVRRVPSSEELKLLQALADSTSVAMENVQVYAELEERVRARTAELQRALGEIKTLRGLIPLCAWCREKVRDPAGVWQSLEQYVGANTEATFSHTVCPDCASKEFTNLERTF